LFHPLVWGPAAIVGLVILGYLILDPDRIARGVAVGGKDASTVLDLMQQAQFFLLEAGLIGAAILAIRRSAEVALALVILALLPLIYLGPANDLVMRASIPSLAVLTIGACVALFAPAPAAAAAALRKRAALVGLLVVGAVTPLAEISRAVFLPVWPINETATLIGVNCGQFAPHYVARLGHEVIGRMLRPVHAIALGPQGPSACNNPALELMWSWHFLPREKLRFPTTASGHANKTQETRVAE
jgi:hypothetical protein